MPRLKIEKAEENPFEEKDQKPKAEDYGLDCLLDPGFEIDEAELMDGSKEAMSLLDSISGLIDA